MSIFVDERKIWWIVSYPKSGSTWIRMFMNAYITGFPLDINTGFQYAYGDNLLTHFQSVACRPADQLTATEQVFYRPAVLMTHISMSAAKHVCLKSHNAKVQVDGIPLFPPKLSAGALYIVRDPRDIAISFADHLGSDVTTTIKNMNDTQYISEHVQTKLIHILTTWSLHIETWTEKNKDIPVKIIRYEDLLKDPHYEFEQVLNGLGFEKIDRDRFNFALEQTKFVNLQALEEKNGFRERGMGSAFFRVGKSNQWKDILTREELIQIEKDHGGVMRKFGYELVTGPLLHPKTPSLSNV